jgi:ribosomal protein S18 acetylase RimI-like enzyme
MLTIRPAVSAKEFALFLKLMKQYAATDLADPQNSSIWKDMANLPGRYAPPGGLVLLARWSGAVAACGAFAPTAHAGLAEMKRMYVRPKFRGRGIGRNIAHALLHAAHQAGYARIAISTWGHNDGAIKLYTALGFGPCAPFKTHPSSDLVFMDKGL